MGDPSDEWKLWKRQGLPVKSDSVSDIDNLSDESEEDTVFTSCISNIYPSVGGTNTPSQGDSHSDPLASSATSMCSLESIVTFFRKHFNEFQNSFNDSWTMREANFCQRSLSNMSDIVAKMDRFDHTYHQFVTNFNGHMLEILHLNVESLLLSMKAFIQCCGSLQHSKHNSGVALYPEELIQTMKVLIEQSLRAVNTAWLTFLQSTNCQIDEFPIDQTWPQKLSSEGAIELEKNDTMTYNLNEKDNVSPYKYIRKDLCNEETISKEPESKMKMNLCTESAEPSSNVTSDTSGLVERLGPQNLQPPQNREHTETMPRKGDCFNSQPTFALKECSVTLENRNTYNLKHTPKIQQGTVVNHIWDGVSPEIQDHALPQNRNVTEQSLQNTDNRTSLSKPEEIRISKNLLASSENRSKTGKHKRKPCSKSPNKTPTKKPTPESLPMESLPTHCADRGTQTPSKLSALHTSSTAAPRGNSIIHNKNLEKNRCSKPPSEILDKPENKSRLEQSQTISSVNHKKKTEYKDDANPSSKDNLPLNQDHPLTTFVSSFKSYQCSPTSMNVSLQVACVERKVLARRFLIEEAKKQLEKKKSRHGSRKRPLDTRRSEKSDTSNENKSRKSLDEKTSSTPQKRVKKTDDVVNKKNSEHTNSISNYSHCCADQHGKSENDSNNNTTEQGIQNSNNLVNANKQRYEPVNSQQNCVNKGYKKQNTHQIGALMLLEEEDQFFLNQQADLTARIKSTRKMKANSGGNLLSSTPNHAPGQADDIHKQPQKYSDPNNNVKSS